MREEIIDEQEGMESKTEGEGSTLGKGKDFPLRRNDRKKRLVVEGSTFIIGRMGS